jgi:hypothetical protein
MTKRLSRKVAVVNYQNRAKDFAIGDMVYPYTQVGAGMNPTAYSGRIVAVWPAIGMVDVEFPTGNTRFPVEELQKTHSQDAVPPKPTADTVPGGAGSEPVSAGPKDADPGQKTASRIASRVAQAYVKRALYWGASDRHYRATRSELDQNSFCCPRCDKESLLQKAVYKREDGQSVRLLACKKCLFLIKPDQILNHPTDE